MKNYIIFTGFQGIDGCRDCGIMIVPILCQGSAVFHFTNSDMTSIAVSDTTQKKGGDSHHTICNAVGTTSYASSSDTGRISDAGRT